MNLLRSTKMKIASMVIGVFACIYAVLEGLLFGFLIALFVGIGEGLGGNASWLTASTLSYLGLGCIFFALVDLIGVIFVSKRPFVGGIMLCLATIYITAFGVIFCIFANGQVGAIFLALGGIVLHLASTILAFLAAKNHTATMQDDTTINMVNSSIEAGDTPIDVAHIPWDSNAALEDGSTPLDASESLSAINALKGSAPSTSEESELPNKSPLHDNNEQRED